MKGMYFCLLVAALFFAGACQPAETPPTDTDKEEIRAPGTEPAADANDVRAEIAGLERQMWELWKSKKYDDMIAQTTLDAVFVSASGVGDRQDLLADLKRRACEVESYSMENVEVLTPIPGAALIVYRCKAEAICAGERLSPIPDMNSSLWVKHGDRWLTAFHHQQPAAE
jgi:hypothetical protein